MNDITIKDGWLTDANGNKASISYFGSERAARKALLSLKNCENCINCSNCSNCSGCSGCAGCVYCSRCSDCVYCSRCSDCAGCSRCSDQYDKTGDHIYIDVPVIENIHTRVFEAASAEGALDMDSVHTCQTIHCRAGWVVHLAGADGYALESHFGWDLAARMIYDASGYKISPVEFHKTNDEAMADMKRLAELEAAQ